MFKCCNCSYCAVSQVSDANRCYDNQFIICVRLNINMFISRLFPYFGAHTFLVYSRRFLVHKQQLCHITLLNVNTDCYGSQQNQTKVCHMKSPCFCHRVNTMAAPFVQNNDLSGIWEQFFSDPFLMPPTLYMHDSGLLSEVHRC